MAVLANLGPQRLVPMTLQSGLVIETLAEMNQLVNQYRGRHKPVLLTDDDMGEISEHVESSHVAAWRETMAPFVAVINDVTAELEFMREELLEGLLKALHGAGGQGNDYTHTLRQNMLVKVMESLKRQSRIVDEAEGVLSGTTASKWSSSTLNQKCLASLSELQSFLHKGLPMELFILQSSRPTHPSIDELREKVQQLRVLDQNTAAIVENAWRSCCWQFPRLQDHRETFKHKSIRRIMQDQWQFAEADLQLIRVKKGVEVAQEIKRRAVSATPEAQGEKVPQEVHELQELRKELKESQSNLMACLQPVLNAHASRALADRAWQGNACFVPASISSSLASWKFVGCSHDGSWTIQSSSWISSSSCCFLKDALFKIKTDAGFEYCEAQELQVGSQVVAENGQIIEVKNPPEHHVVQEMVQLETASAFLQISLDHRIVRPDKSTVPARELLIGDEVMVNGRPEALTLVRHVAGEADVTKLVFSPDLPVTVGHNAHDEGIASKGRKPRRGRPQKRGGRNRKARPRSWPGTESEPGTPRQ